jgi:hypothetical protein
VLIRVIRGKKFEKSTVPGLLPSGSPSAICETKK